jgi:predicted 3-demethylubiquinone-9 3-methyltransferase (glyoxalase superfamily)
VKKITPFLWFDSQAEEAMRFYCSIFPNSKELGIARYGEGGPGKPGSVMTAHFELDGQEFIALNGGPLHPFTEAVSFSIDCKSQEEVDRYWSKLTAGGKEVACGWLKDKYGLCWQVVPDMLPRLLADKDRAKANRVMQAMLQMTKLDIAALERAAG